MSTIDPRLETVLSVLENKNYSKAARELNLTQPAVSQHISSLEKEFDIKIFNRVNGEMIPTPIGKVLIKYAKRYTAITKELAKAIQDEKKETTNLNVGITHSSEGNIVPEVLIKYSEKHPGTTIKIISDDIKNLYEKLSNYEIDFAIVEGKVPLDRFSKIMLDSDPVVAIVSKDSKYAKRNTITISELRKEKLILRTSGSATRKIFQSQLDLISMSLDDFNVVLQIDNTSVIKNLVEKDMGVSVMPKSVCYQEIKNKTLIALTIQDMNMVAENNLVYLKSYNNDAVINELISIYKSMSK